MYFLNPTGNEIGISVNANIVEALRIGDRAERYGRG
jgi:hypothetical protein